jgi:tripartite-type tricarboxylate transporter receptor subunit TctC
MTKIFYKQLFFFIFVWVFSCSNLSAQLLVKPSNPKLAVVWPNKAVTLVVGYPAGSGIDTVARFLAQELREKTNQAWIVDNKPGAVANLAARYVANSAPDGYTVLFTPNSTHGINPHIFKNLGFDPIKDFQPVTSLLSLGFVLLVNPKVVPVNTVDELSSYLKNRPGKLAYASGNASGHVAAEWYKQIVGFDAVHVPYKGVPQAISDMIGGNIHFMFADATLGIPTAKSGKLKALAVTNSNRVPSIYDVPTMTESGVPGYDFTSWFGVFFPASIPLEITEKFASLCNGVMATDKAKEFLRGLGAEPFPNTPENFTKIVEREINKWGPIVKAARMEAE